MEEFAIPGLMGIIAGTYAFAGKMAYRHVMDAFKAMMLRDDALGKRLVSYEQRNVTQHSEILQRLSHVEALVNGKGG